MKRGKSSVDSTASLALSTLDAVPEADQAIEETAEETSVHEPKMVEIVRDGKTVWIPETVIEQYSTSRPTSSNRYKRPDMKITIPQWPSQNSITKASRALPAASTASEGSIYSEAGGNIIVVDRNGERFIARSPDHPRPVHPLEQAAMLEAISLGSSPVSGHSRDSSYSSYMRSPASSQYSNGTSRSSFEITTPKDASPIGPTHKKNWSIVDPAMEGVFDSPTYSPPPRNPLRASAMGSTVRQKSPVPTQIRPQPDSLQSPTLSQAANQLERELSLRGLATPDIIMRILAEYETSPVSTPPIPSRSMRRTAPEPAVDEDEPILPPRKNRQSFGDLSKTVVEQTQGTADRIDSNDAETVIYQVFLRVHGLEDIFSLAQINRGFYDVYKRHELELAKVALRNSLPAAWEHLEVSPKQIFSSLEQSGSDYPSLSRYLQSLARDTYILTAVKSVVLIHCQSFLRSETVDALRGQDVNRAAQIDNALWRIWSFCELFGCGKSPGDDIAAQTAWLRGDSDFAHGNPDGLTACELYDMTELWNCMRSLLSSIQGGPERLAQARSHGVFPHDDDLSTNDPAKEDHALEEWINHLLTLGLSAILDLSTPATNPSDTVFCVAATMGWTTWRTPSTSTSTSACNANFLKEAVSIVYQERITATLPPSISSPPSAKALAPRRPQRTHRNSKSAMQDHWAAIARRAHGQALAAELIASKKAASTGTTPLLIGDERPMSVISETEFSRFGPGPAELLRDTDECDFAYRGGRARAVTSPERGSLAAGNGSGCGGGSGGASACAASLTAPFEMPMSILSTFDDETEQLTPTTPFAPSPRTVAPPPRARIPLQILTCMPPQSQHQKGWRYTSPHEDDKKPRARPLTELKMPTSRYATSPTTTINTTINSADFAVSPLTSCSRFTLDGSSLTSALSTGTVGRTSLLERISMGPLGQCIAFPVLHEGPNRGRRGAVSGDRGIAGGWI